VVERDTTRFPADDGYERYYVEKLWSWIPEVYKTEDGNAFNPGVLRAFIEILASQAATARRSIDRLWEDAFIETCDDWSVPYIGELVGTRLVNELNYRGQRVDVARTIFYRRRKGTLLVLETLIRDLLEREGVVVESFRRLARTRHGLDAEPGDLGGAITASPPGGWPDLRSIRVSEIVDGPFDEFAHTPDVRQLAGHRGRYNIPKLNFHVYRQLAYEVELATPFDFGNGRFTMDPSGRDVPLFRPGQRPGTDRWRPAVDWEIPAPIPCTLLGAARYRIDAELVDFLQTTIPSAAAEIELYLGNVFESETRLRETLESLPHGADAIGEIDTILRDSITEDSPKANLYPPLPAREAGDPSLPAVEVSDSTMVVDGDTYPGEAVERQKVVAGNLEDWGSSLSLAPEKELVIDPQRGRFWFPAGAPDMVFVPRYHYGLQGSIGAGTYDRPESGDEQVDEDFSSLMEAAASEIPQSGVAVPGPESIVIPSTGTHEFVDNKTYHASADVADIEQLLLRSADGLRPYLLRLTASPPLWTFTASAKAIVPPGEEDPEANRRLLMLLGLWIGVADEASAPVASPVPTGATLILDGTFDHVVIRNATLDPGGEKARLDPSLGEPIPYVRLLVRGSVERLTVESSIIGPIGEDTVAGQRGSIQYLVVRDSVIQSIDPGAVAAIDTELGDVSLERVTVFGDVACNRLHATETIVQGAVRVTDNQHGCFRFSATQEEDAQLPPQFESLLFEGGIPDHFFISRRFGDPGYAQLSENASPEILRGAESGSEMGAFSSLLLPVKLRDLEAKVQEFMPFGRIPQIIFET